MEDEEASTAPSTIATTNVSRSNIVVDDWASDDDEDEYVTDAEEEEGDYYDDIASPAKSSGSGGKKKARSSSKSRKKKKEKSSSATKSKKKTTKEKEKEKDKEKKSSSSSSNNHSKRRKSKSRRASRSVLKEQAGELAGMHPDESTKSLGLASVDSSSMQSAAASVRSALSASKEAAVASPATSQNGYANKYQVDDPKDASSELDEEIVTESNRDDAKNQAEANANDTDDDDDVEVEVDDNEELTTKPMKNGKTHDEDTTSAAAISPQSPAAKPVKMNGMSQKQAFGLTASPLPQERSTDTVDEEVNEFLAEAEDSEEGDLPLHVREPIPIQSSSSHSAKTQVTSPKLTTPRTTNSHRSSRTTRASMADMSPKLPFRAVKSPKRKTIASATPSTRKGIAPSSSNHSMKSYNSNKTPLMPMPSSQEELQRAWELLQQERAKLIQQCQLLNATACFQCKTTYEDKTELVPCACFSHGQVERGIMLCGSCSNVVDESFTCRQDAVANKPPSITRRGSDDANSAASASSFGNDHDTDDDDDMNNDKEAQDGSEILLKGHCESCHVNLCQDCEFTSCAEAGCKSKLCAECCNDNKDAWKLCQCGKQLLCPTCQPECVMCNDLLCSAYCKSTYFIDEQATCNLCSNCKSHVDSTESSLYRRDPQSIVLIDQQDMLEEKLEIFQKDASMDELILVNIFISDHVKDLLVQSFVAAMMAAAASRQMRRWNLLAMKDCKGLVDVIMGAAIFASPHLRGLAYHTIKTDPEYAPIQVLCSGLKFNSTLQRIQLRTATPFEGVRKSVLEDALSSNQTIKQVDVMGCGLSLSGRQQPARRGSRFGISTTSPTLPSASPSSTSPSSSSKKKVDSKQVSAALAEESAEPLADPTATVDKRQSADAMTADTTDESHSSDSNNQDDAMNKLNSHENGSGVNSRRSSTSSNGEKILEVSSHVIRTLEQQRLEA
eukprot:CAMPEP_0119556982 /NCGR_PEP_ID=MMETSP1352-20130426/8766_1 /TAXON_ID=265584 /ORGANISM="Stauroneis constricta, Strain CCMP1120" /LENGTH=953 /DNA_ID=CAMNT_0007603999 /DNA_START=363 /DNA_END=3224 /DNA_ORIENTATION=+